MTKFDEIAEYAQAHDFSTEMEQGVGRPTPRPIS